MRKDIIALILVSAALGAMAQLLLKTGMNNYGSITFGLDMIIAVFEPYVFTGLITYFISSITWVLLLSKTELSYAYPFASLGYVMVAFLSWAFIGEAISITRMIGIGIIILGVIIVGKSK